ncbi:unnamed protein product, partial [Ilex paraguariensis]
ALGSLRGQKRWPLVVRNKEKKKNDPHTESIGIKNVTCERQVDRPNDDFVRAIEGHGLHFWFKEVRGYIIPYDEDRKLLKTNVRGKVIEVNLTVIAKALHY